ncbi:uncharacterized protein LOC136091272 [Hydra vulgaris]|uniref:Uncharacterized protein LOC136091272 n=1 Tax=Hydra vulgaris TaxID=6087 RepID=A0ABM4DJL5_HYDVU
MSVNQSGYGLLFACTILLPSVSLFITRLPCKSYASFNFTKSKYYLGDIDSTYSVNSINHCAIYCVRNPTCAFANFNENQKICELMSSKPNSSNNIVDQQWQVLMSETENNTNIGSICENNNPCNTVYCRDICLSGDPLVHSYICSETYDVSRNAVPSLSTTYPGCDAIYSIDGNPLTEATSHQYYPKWFKLDLKYIFQIYQIVIYNGQYYWRTNGNRLIVSITDLETDYKQIATLNNDMKQIFDGPYVARYILIFKDISDLLTLGEINVYA